MQSRSGRCRLVFTQVVHRARNPDTEAYTRAHVKQRRCALAHSHWTHRPHLSSVERAKVTSHSICAPRSHENSARPRWPRGVIVGAPRAANVVEGRLSTCLLVRHNGSETTGCWNIISFCAGHTVISQLLRKCCLAWLETLSACSAAAAWAVRCSLIVCGAIVVAPCSLGGRVALPRRPYERVLTVPILAVLGRLLP